MLILNSRREQSTSAEILTNIEIKRRMEIPEVLLSALVRSFSFLNFPRRLFFMVSVAQICLILKRKIVFETIYLVDCQEVTI